MMLEGLTEEDMKTHYRMINGVNMREFEPPFFKFLPWIMFGFVLGAFLGGTINMVMN